MDDYGIGKPPPSTNRSAATTACVTCGGDRFVVVRLRSPVQTMWMWERNIQPAHDSFYEEMAPCPDCNLSAYQGLRTMDPAAVRQAIAQ